MGLAVELLLNKSARWLWTPLSIEAAESHEGIQAWSAFYPNLEFHWLVYPHYENEAARKCLQSRPQFRCDIYSNAVVPYFGMIVTSIVFNAAEITSNKPKPIVESA
jgi:hypothetical protein